MPQNNSLMGFSVHQPAIGKSLQFFPALGSKQLDEMIDAYVPGDASISEKRAAVSLEFFEHTLATGELFKFFMVYPALGSTTESPVDSMVDSGYASNFTSPIMSERQWTQSSHCSPSLSESSARRSSYKKAASPTDFSHIPGMKILTRDGRDVTNSASRGCKTKEQRDHAHLMRIIKACESCRKKKVRCDPSHKRLAGTSVAKTAKKAKKPAAVSAPPPAPSQLELGTSLYAPSDSAPPIDLSLLSSSFDYLTPEPLGDGSIDWDEFIYYEEPMDTIPYDYNIFHPTNYLSPASYNSFLSSQPITPNSASSAKAAEGSAGGTATQDLLPPYLQPGGEIGTEYADFNLYSPGSSTCLDDDPGLAREVAATSRLEYSAHHYHQQPSNYYRQRSSPPSDGSPLSRFIADVPAGHILREETYSPTNLNSPQRLQISDRQASQISSDMPYGDSRLTRFVSGPVAPVSRDRYSLPSATENHAFRPQTFTYDPAASADASEGPRGSQPSSTNHLGSGLALSNQQIPRTPATTAGANNTSASSLGSSLDRARGRSRRALGAPGHRTQPVSFSASLKYYTTSAVTSPAGPSSRVPLAKPSLKTTHLASTKIGSSTTSMAIRSSHATDPYSRKGSLLVVTGLAASSSPYEMLSSLAAISRSLALLVLGATVSIPLHPWWGPGDKPGQLSTRTSITWSFLVVASYLLLFTCSTPGRNVQIRSAELRSFLGKHAATALDRLRPGCYSQTCYVSEKTTPSGGCSAAKSWGTRPAWMLGAAV